jgi:hypothetical protein
VRGGISFWRRASKGSVAGGTVGEGRFASEDQLLGLRVANDDGIVVAAVKSCISTVRQKLLL